MMKTPREFLEQFDKWNQGFKVALGQVAAKQRDQTEMLRFAADFRQLYARWRHRLRDPQKLAMLDNLHRDLSRLLERLFNSDVMDVLRAHQHRLAATSALGSLAKLKEDLRDASPEATADLIQQHREELGDDLDVEKAVPRWEERLRTATEQEAAHVAKLKTHWPSRVDQALLDRMEATDFDEAYRWGMELDARNKAPD